MKPGLVLALLSAACTHSEPFGPAPPEGLGPAAPALPRRLTFNPGDDRAPTVAGGLVAYSRYDPANLAWGECIALLPVEGGTLTATFCPPPPTPTDTFTSSWLEPALSPDGRQIAYIWRRSGPVSLTAWSYHLIVADVDSPAVPRFSRQMGGPVSGGRFYNSAIELVWTAPDRLRLLAAWVEVGRLAEARPGRLTDTATIPRALMDLDLATGSLDRVPGGDFVAAWTHNDQGTFVVPAGQPSRVFRLQADGSATPLGDLPDSVTDLAAAGPWLVATVGTRVLRLLRVPDGQASSVVLPGVAYRLAAVGPDRVVVEIERTMDEFGGPANLWLSPLPAAGSR